MFAFCDRGDELRRALAGNSEPGALSRRLERGGASCAINSFTAGTPVETEKGVKPIEEIAAGDKVLAQDPETGLQGYFEVVALTNHPAGEIFRVTLETGESDNDRNTLDTKTGNAENQDNTTTRPTDHPAKPEVMEVTPEHPVYVEGKGWVWAENLAIGDRLRRADGGWAKVLAVERVELEAPQRVYNFTVKGPHTYFVLEVGVLVHNARCNPADYPNLQRNLEMGGFLPEESHEIIRRFSEAGVTDDQLKMMDKLLAKARTVEVNGVKLMVMGDEAAEEFLVWRIAKKGRLDSYFARADFRNKQLAFSASVARGKMKGLKGTDEQIFLKETAPWHAESDLAERVRSPHVATGGHLAPIVRTRDKALLAQTVLKSDTIHLLQIPHTKLEFDYVKNSETEILANAMHEPLDAHLIIGLPNIFTDEVFTKRLRGN